MPICDVENMVKTTLRISHATRARLSHIDPRRFGRRVSRACLSRADAQLRQLISDDLRLFAMTFAAGFLFVIVFCLGLDAQSQARWSFQPSQAAMRQLDGDEQQLSPTGRRPACTATVRISDADDHRPGIDDVVGRHRPRRLRLVDGRRQEGVERHDEHAAGDRDPEQGERSSKPALGWKMKLPSVVSSAPCSPPVQRDE